MKRALIVTTTLLFGSIVLNVYLYSNNSSLAYKNSSQSGQLSNYEKQIELKDEQINTRDDLQQCIDNANASYEEKWGNKCGIYNSIQINSQDSCKSRQGISHSYCEAQYPISNNCESLPNHVADEIEESISDMKNDCKIKYQ